MARVYRDSGIVDRSAYRGRRRTRRARRSTRDPATPVIALATAHPAKFPEAVERAIGARPALPPPSRRCSIAPRTLRRPAQRSRARSANSSASARGSRRERAADDLAVGPARRHRREPASAHRLARRVRRRRLAPRTRRTSTGSRICSSTWRSRARAGATRAQIAETIENVGGDLNAETGAEQTGYFAHVLGEDVDLALDVLADILTDSQFDPEELAREKNVIMQEIGAVEDTPDDLVFDLFTAAAWPRSADRPADPRHARERRRLRSRRDRRLSAPPLSRRLDAWSPRAGAVDHDRIVALRRSAARRRSARDEPSRRRRPRYLGGEIARQEAARADAYRRRLRGPRRSPTADHDAAHVFAAATGGGMSSRLFQEVREKRGLAYSIYAFHWGLCRQRPVRLLRRLGRQGRRRADRRAALDCLAEATVRLDDGGGRRAPRRR